MTDLAALLAAVRAHPHDDTPRLVYADWLEEYGDQPARAEFIRVQCELASDPGRKECRCGACDEGNGVVCFVRQCERRLWDSHAKQWFGDIGEATNVMLHNHHECAVHAGLGSRYDTVVRRGFVDEVRCDLAAFLRVAPALFAEHPVTEVRLTDRDKVTSYWWITDDVLDEPPGESHWLPMSFKGHFDADHWVTRRWYESAEGSFDYRTHAEATAALSAACVSYGRSVATTRLQPA